jgi:CoA:oxalate CoA-transferase
MKMKKALEDLRILDFTAHLAGPFCTMQLADLGAEVLKIEPPSGDRTRSRGVDEARGESPYFLSVNRNKKGMVLNLKNEKGLKILQELVKISDVVVENYRPGVTKRLGIDYETLKEINPKLVYASISGFGQTGPYRKRTSFDQVAQAMSGMMHLSGYGGPPSSTAGSISDIIPALYTAISILAAVHFAMKTGLGQYIDVAQVHSTTAAMPIPLQNFLITNQEFWRYNPNPGTDKIYPMNELRATYQTKDGYISINTLFQFMDIFTELLAQYIPGILDEWKRDGCISRETHERIVEYIKSKTSDEMESILDRGSIPYGRVYTLPELVNDPQVIAREMFVNIEHSLGLSYKTVSSPMKMSLTPTIVERPPPLLGQHSKEILIDLLGYTEEEHERLREDGVI